MNVEHAADIFINFETDTAIVMRRRGLMFWESMETLTSKLIGGAVSDALAPEKQMRLRWTSESKYPDLQAANWQIVIAWRANCSVTVGTPVCAWGKAPDLTLPEYPTMLSLGEAVLAQAKYSADQQARLR